MCCVLVEYLIPVEERVAGELLHGGRLEALKLEWGLWRWWECDGEGTGTAALPVRLWRDVLSALPVLLPATAPVDAAAADTATGRAELPVWLEELPPGLGRIWEGVLRGCAGGEVQLGVGCQEEEWGRVWHTSEEEGASSIGKQNQKMEPQPGLDVAPMVPPSTFICVCTQITPHTNIPRSRQLNPQQVYKLEGYIESSKYVHIQPEVPGM